MPTDRTQASQLLKIRIGIVGIPGVHGDVGVPDLRPDGRFRTTFCRSHRPRRCPLLVPSGHLV